MSLILTAPDQRMGQKESITLTPDLGGETIGWAEWSTIDGGLVTSGPASSSTQASAFVQGDSAGVGHVRCAVTTSTGRVIPFIVKITIDPLTED